MRAGDHDQGPQFGLQLRIHGNGLLIVRQRVRVVFPNQRQVAQSSMGRPVIRIETDDGFKF
jgi:hypothetical protein